MPRPTCTISSIARPSRSTPRVDLRLNDQLVACYQQMETKEKSHWGIVTNTVNPQNGANLGPVVSMYDTIAITPWLNKFEPGHARKMKSASSCKRTRRN